MLFRSKEITRFIPFFRQLRFYRDVNIGDKAEITKIFSIDDVNAFSRVSEDHNPIHANLEEAKKAGMNGIVVHGVLCLGLLSAVIGTRVIKLL